MPKVNMIDVLFIFEKLDVGCFKHFYWFVRILFSDLNQTFHFYQWFLKFWPLMAFFGLYWMIFLRKDQPSMISIKQNWGVSINQMSKPISESKSPIYSTVAFVVLGQFRFHVFLVLFWVSKFQTLQVEKLPTWWRFNDVIKEDTLPYAPAFSLD